MREDAKRGKKQKEKKRSKRKKRQKRGKRGQEEEVKEGASPGFGIVVSLSVLFLRHAEHPHTVSCSLTFRLPTVMMPVPLSPSSLILSAPFFLRNKGEREAGLGCVPDMTEWVDD
jgi:hypothetical protein